jgi:hypothetical protein
MLLLIESSLVLIAVVVALLRPRWGERWFTPVERRFAQLARRRTLSVVVVGASALGIRAALLPVLPIPEPAVHDEFSYLLAADTYAHGRLANPTHPMWVHFETFHVNQEPTYVSMYYPAQGIFLALGQRVFGHPFWGVWLSAGLMCGAICWMLQGWVAPVWALLGGFLSVMRLGVFSYWMNSYWGGAVAALGGALVLGALPRIKRHQRLWHVVLMGIGFAVLANSRPYEGIFFSIPVITTLALWIRRPSTPPFRTIATRVIAPLLGMFVLTLGLMGYYFWRTTGNPVETPYLVNAKTYFSVPFFPWQRSTNFPVYRHAVMQKFYTGWVASEYALCRTHPIISVLLRGWLSWFFFLGPLLTLPLICGCFAVPYGTRFRDFSRNTRFLLIACGCAFLASLLPIGFDPHYLAPITAALYALLLLAISNVRRWNPRGQPSGVAVVRSLLVAGILVFAVRAAVPSTYAQTTPATWYSPFIFETYREQIQRNLLATVDRHLILVRYSPEHIVNDEWVYNQADIDGSKVVWARDMGAENNLEVIRYFKDRKVWLLEPDVVPPKLAPYPHDSSHAPVERLASADEVR